MCKSAQRSRCFGAKKVVERRKPLWSATSSSKSALWSAPCRTPKPLGKNTPPVGEQRLLNSTRRGLHLSPARPVVPLLLTICGARGRSQDRPKHVDTAKAAPHAEPHRGRS